VKAIKRILAVSSKEWLLNLRFPVDYLVNNAVNPLKTAVLMFLIYRGFLTENQHLGLVGKGTYAIFVLIGTSCHSLFLNSVLTFRTKMVAEKYWLTILGTLVSPASIFEVIGGFIIGSVGIHLFFSACMLVVVAFFFKATVSTVLISMLLMFLISIIGFGLGLILTTINLVWEGKMFLFDYGLQLIIFLSCFYYPIETLPNFVRPSVHLLPTYRAAEAIQHLFIFGSVEHFPQVLLYLAVSAVIILCVPAIFLDYSIKRFGITGY
jgi:ABC-type polysaccharide/polyol phosphate export permease